MAQSVAIPGDKRHSFSLRKAFSYPDIGRISELAVTKFGNVIMCDNLRNKLVLFDEDGNYLSYLPVEGDPWNIAINKDNVAFITIPNKSKVLVVDPDILRFRLFKEIDGGGYLPNCVSAVHNESTVMIAMNDPPQILNVYDNLSGQKLSAHLEESGCSKIYSRKDSNITHYVCVPGQNSISRTTGGVSYYHNRPKSYDIKIPTMTVPSDICSDDNGHIYVSGQYSHNIHRLTEDEKVLDIPLHSRHGIKHPVPMCFNQTCTKFYIANEFGTNIQMYDVV